MNKRCELLCACERAGGLCHCCLSCLIGISVVYLMFVSCTCVFFMLSVSYIRAVSSTCCQLSVCDLSYTRCTCRMFVVYVNILLSYSLLAVSIIYLLFVSSPCCLCAASVVYLRCHLRVYDKFVVCVIYLL